MTSLASLQWPRRTERLELRAARTEDIPAITTVRALPGVSEWLSAAGTPEEIATRFADPDRLGAAIVVRHEGRVVGDAMMSIGDSWAQAEVRADAEASQAELGWVLAPAVSGQGLGTELVRELFVIAFDGLGLRRVVAECFTDNEPSWRLMERVGMRRETHSIRDGLHRSGHWLDGYSYALLADEWRRAAT